MGALTGSRDVWISTPPRDNSRFRWASLNPVIVTTAAAATEYLDVLPGPNVWNPGMCRSLLRRKLGQLVRSRDAALVDLPDAHGLAKGIDVDSRRSIRKSDVDAPSVGVFRGVAPDEGRGCDLRREDRSLEGIIDRNRGHACSSLVGRCWDGRAGRKSPAESREGHPYHA